MFSIITRGTFAGIVVAATLVGANLALAADQTAEAFLNGIYAHYKGDPKKAHGILLDKDAEIRQYFEPSLADMIIKDDEATKKSGDIPNLDGDPFVDSQEWSIPSFDIKMEHQGDDKATATVKFTNYGKPKLLHVNLVHLKDGWNISDIIWNGDEGSFRALYTKHSGGKPADPSH
jgi:hypothetical protein